MQLLCSFTQNNKISCKLQTKNSRYLQQQLTAKIPVRKNSRTIFQHQNNMENNAKEGPQKTLTTQILGIKNQTKRSRTLVHIQFKQTKVLKKFQNIENSLLCNNNTSVILGILLFTYSYISMALIIENGKADTASYQLPPYLQSDVLFQIATLNMSNIYYYYQLIFKYQKLNFIVFNKKQYGPISEVTQTQLLISFQNIYNIYKIYNILLFCEIIF
eukprot:TRINITY_DN1067_c2_g1_i5.p3 TRINITY_DN1067_c2_g1~~TRINITY_DN1067_c2_g1_i5.p3  ORF type:complete len:216 (+),score=-11.64 TRINITY_DN1067_c2_g1_i5:507-1154(+)